MEFQLVHPCCAVSTTREFALERANIRMRLLVPRQCTHVGSDVCATWEVTGFSAYILVSLLVPVEEGNFGCSVLTARVIAYKGFLSTVPPFVSCQGATQRTAILTAIHATFVWSFSRMFSSVLFKVAQVAGTEITAWIRTSQRALMASFVGHRV